MVKKQTRKTQKHKKSNKKGKRVFYGYVKNRLSKVYKHRVKRGKTTKTLFSTTKKYNPKKRCTCKLYRTKNAAMKKRNKRNNKRHTTRRRKMRKMRGGGQQLHTAYNLSCYNHEPALGHPQSSNNNNNIPPHYQTGTLMLDGNKAENMQKGGGLMHELGLSDLQFSGYDNENALTNLKHRWEGGEPEMPSDPLEQHIAIGSSPNRYFPDVETRHTESKQNVPR